MTQNKLQTLLIRLQSLQLPGVFTIDDGDRITWRYDVEDPILLEATGREETIAKHKELNDISEGVTKEVLKLCGSRVEVINGWGSSNYRTLHVFLTPVDEYTEKVEVAISKLQNSPHPGLFEIKDTRIRWSYIASYVDATRVEDLHSTQNEAMMHVINTIGAGAFRLHSAGNSNDRCWFEIEVV